MAPESMAPESMAPAATGPFAIGYSNGGGVGNGFREEQVCTAKAEVKALGTDKISGITVIHRNTDAAGQLSDLRDLISEERQRDRVQPQRPGRAQPGPCRGA